MLVLDIDHWLLDFMYKLYKIIRHMSMEKVFIVPILYNVHVITWNNIFSIKIILIAFKFCFSLQCTRYKKLRGLVFLTINAKHTCWIPLSRDVHFRVIHTLCTRVQAKNRFSLTRPILYRPTLSVTDEYMRVTTVQVYRVNVWNPLD